MPTVVDLKPHLVKVDHDPTNQMSDDVSQWLSKAGIVGDVGNVLLSLPKMAMQILIEALAVPGALAGLILQFPDIAFTTLEGFLAGIPVVGELVGAITGLVGGALSLLDITKYFGGLEAMLGMPDFNADGFNPLSAVTTFVHLMISPLGLLAPLIGGFLPLGIIPAIPTTLIAGWQELIDVIGNALSFGNVVGQSLHGIGVLLANLRSDTDAAIELSANAWAQAQAIGGTVIQLVTEAEEAVILSPLKLAEQFLSSIGSWFGQTKQSNSPTNPAVTALAGRQAALEAVVLNGSSTTGFNDHLNRSTLGSDYTLLDAHTPLLIFDGADDGYLIGGADICGVHLTAGALPMVTDRNRFQWSLRGFDSFGHTGRHRALICGNPTFTNYLAVEVYHTGFADRIRMFTVTGGTWQSVGDQKTNFTPPHKFREWDTIDIAYDPVTNTFFLYFNSSPADYWTDVGTSPTDPANIITHGSGHREVAAVFNFDDDSGATGLGMDDFSVYDYPVNA